MFRVFHKHSVRSRGAFSLVELVLALGIIAFAGMALLGLFSVGLNNNQTASEELEAAMIAESLLATRRVLPVAQIDCALPPINAESVITPDDGVYLTVEGTITNDPDQARFRMSYSVEPWSEPGQIAKRTSRVHLSLSWPAAARSGTAQGRLEVTTVFTLPEA